MSDCKNDDLVSVHCGRCGKSLIVRLEDVRDLHTVDCDACGKALAPREGATRSLSNTELHTVTVRISLGNSDRSTGRLADAELHFVGGPLAGLKLLGFAIWERHAGGRHVTFPARQYTADGQRRSFTLLRDIPGQNGSQAVRDLILEAYAAALAGPAE